MSAVVALAFYQFLLWNLLLRSHLLWSGLASCCISTESAIEGVQIVGGSSAYLRDVVHSHILGMIYSLLLASVFLFQLLMRCCCWLCWAPLMPVAVSFIIPAIFIIASIWALLFCCCICSICCIIASFLLRSVAGFGFLRRYRHCHSYLCISGEVGELCGTDLFGSHIGEMVVTIHLLIALNGGYVLFVLIFLLVELCLHLCHLLQLVHLTLMAVGFQLVIVHLSWRLRS